MFESFISGAACVFRGTAEFYSDRSLWRYAVFPVILLLVLYLVLGACIVIGAQKVSASVEQYILKLPAWCALLSQIAPGFFSVVFLIAGTVFFLTVLSSLYEVCGSFFFDRLVESYELKRYGIEPVKSSLSSLAVFVANSASYCLKTCVLLCVLSVIALLFPLSGELILLLVMGKRIGISYSAAAWFSRGYTFKECCRIAETNRSAVWGYGIMTYIILLVPAAMIFLLPGAVVGAVILRHEQIKRGV